MTYKKQSNYKTVTWTIKNPDILEKLLPYCCWNNSPQEFVREILFKEGLVRENATKMVSQVNFPHLELGQAFKLSLFTEDHKMLKDAADNAGLKIQQLLEQVLLTTEATYSRI